MSTTLLSITGRYGFCLCLKKFFASTSAWKYFYRAVDNQGKTSDFLLTSKQGKVAALRFFDKAMKASGAPKKSAMDKSDANKAAMNAINARGETKIVIRQVKYLNNLVEPDRRAIN